jgi:hypothetical protein
MKARNREINIFNMSLLDILCGALGAFCFMMLVLFPYYKQKPQDSGEKGVPPATYEQALAEIERLKQLLSSCRGDHESCKTDLKQSNSQLSMKNPITAVATFVGANDVDVYVEDDRVAVNGNHAPKVDGSKKQGVTFSGDVHYDAPTGTASDIWLVRDAPKDVEFRVYFKLVKTTGERKSTWVAGYILLSAGQPIGLPVVELKSEGEVLRVATIKHLADGKVSVHIDLPNAPQPQSGK